MKYVHVRCNTVVGCHTGLESFNVSLWKLGEISFSKWLLLNKFSFMLFADTSVVLLWHTVHSISLPIYLYGVHEEIKCKLNVRHLCYYPVLTQFLLDLFPRIWKLNIWKDSCYILCCMNLKCTFPWGKNIG